MTTKAELDELERLAKVAGDNGRSDQSRRHYRKALQARLDPTTVLSLVAEVRRARRLESAMEFLDRGDGNRGTHGADMRAPAILEMAKRLGWKETT